MSGKEDGTLKTSKAKYFMVVLAAAGLIGNCFGVGINIAGNFFTPVADAFGIGRGSVSLTLTIYNLVQAFTGMIAPQAVSRFGLKKMICLGTLLQALSTFLLSMAPDIFVMDLLQAVRGFGAGIAGVVIATALINHWFNRSNALMVSIAMCFSGLAGALMSPLTASLISASGWQAGYRVSALVIILLGLPAMVCPLTLTPQEAGMEPYGGSLERTEDTASASSIHMIHKSAVLLLVLYTFLSAFTSALPQHFPGIADAYGLAGTGAFMISVCMIMNSAGKVLLGMTIDKLGARRSIDLFALLVFAGAFLIANVPVKGVLLGASALYGLTYSIETVGPASITREVFGSENYEKVYPKCALASTTANAAGTTLIGVMYDAGGNYESTMILILAALVLSLVSLHFIYRKGIGKQS